MQILNEMGTLKDGRTVLLIKDAYNPNFAIVRGYDRQTGTWDSGTYCDGNLVALAKEILEAELPIGYDRMKVTIDIPKEFEKDLADKFNEFFERVKLDIESGMRDMKYGNRLPMCGNYEHETAIMLKKAFSECSISKEV